MKKLLTIATVLLTAALVFTGCSNPASSGDGDDGEKLPGTWVSSLDNLTSGTSGKWTNNGKKVSFSCSDATSLGIPSGYVSTLTRAISQTQLYGVRAKIKQDAFTEAEPGLILFLDTSTDNSGNTSFDTYYRLTFWKGSYTLYEKEEGKKEVCLSSQYDAEKDKTYENTWNDAIKEEGNENEVLFYTDGDKLVLKINGTLIKTIDKKLDIGPVCTCMHVPGGLSGAINANWEFLEFQTAK